MTPPPRRRTPSRRRSAAPVLRPAFFVASVAIVLAVVALDRDSAVGDAVVFALVLLFTALVMRSIRRLLDEQTPTGGDAPDRSAEGSS